VRFLPTTGQPYILQGAIDDFLHSIERTAPIGFGYEQIGDGIWVHARHGTKDALVSPSSVEETATRCGWTYTSYHGATHMLPLDAVEDGFREIVETLNGVRQMGM
ncbi:hypothetical protein HK101_004559, partial [Irineochytrium annulatum]